MDRTTETPASDPRSGTAELTPGPGLVKQTADQPTTARVSHSRSYASLKAFLAENASLVFFVGSLTSLTTFVVNLQLGWLDTYLKAILLAAAGTVWFEFHAQWPEEMRLDRGRHARPTAGVWRLVAFSYLMQLSVVLIGVWAVVQAPEVTVPLLVVGATVATWHRLVGSRPHRAGILVALVAVAFLAAELALERLFPHEPTLIDRFATDAMREAERIESGS